MKILIVTMINNLHENGVLELAILTSVFSQQIIICINRVIQHQANNDLPWYVFSISDLEASLISSSVNGGSAR